METSGQRGDNADEDGAHPPSKPTVPDHELIRCIGTGAFGEVWLARSFTGAFRAVKIVYRNSLQGDGYERELRGIQAFEPVSRAHPNLVNILHVGEDKLARCFFYVMELADDTASGNGREFDPEAYEPKTLQGELHRRGYLSFQEAHEIALSLTSSLIFLHGQGLVHRDIKPANIIFVGGDAKLADIGLVVSVGRARTFVGTDGYVPREGPGKPPADIYSLGKVLYETITGLDRNLCPRLPENWAERPDKKQLQKLNDIILRACEENKDLRYQIVEDLRVDLWRIRPSRHTPFLNWGTWITTLALLAFTGFFTVYILPRLRGGKPKSQASKVILATDEKAAGFVALFNGTNLDGWNAPGTNWLCVKGTLARINSGGDITYEGEQMSDSFDLRFEWKVAFGSDSGVLYRPNRVEYQILDNKGSSWGTDPNTRAGSLFDYSGAPKDRTKPVGQWNESRIVCEGDRIRHYLNGEEILDTHFNNPEWEEARNRLKLKYNSDLNVRGGYLVLRDEQGPVWYRNIRWKKLE